MNGAVQRMRATLRAAGASAALVRAAQGTYTEALRTGDSLAWTRFYRDVQAAVVEAGPLARRTRAHRALEELQRLLDDDFGRALFKYELHDSATVRTRIADPQRQTVGGRM